MTTTQSETVRIVGYAGDQTVAHLPELGEERTYVVTARCRGHRVREVAGDTVIVADMVQTTVVEQRRCPVSDTPQPSRPRGKHSCEFDWCETRSDGEPDHSYSSSDVRATESTSASAPFIATGVMLKPDHPPAVFVHLHGGDRDVDTYMTHADATRFHEHFVQAMSRAREAV